MAKLCIKQVAQREGWKQQDLAEKASVTVQLLSRYWNNNLQRVDLEELEKIANALGIEPSELVVSNKRYRAMTELEVE